jgi:hypothetical protein
MATPLSRTERPKSYRPATTIDDRIEMRSESMNNLGIILPETSLRRESVMTKTSGRTKQNRDILQLG